MKKCFQASFIITLCSLLYLPAPAEQTRELIWEDLIPAYVKSEKPFAKLTQEQREDLY